MKKTYINPDVTIINIHADVICTSDPATQPSGSIGNELGNGTALAPDRYGRNRYDADYDLY